MKKILLIAALLLVVGLACSLGRNATPTATEPVVPTLGTVPTEVSVASPVPTDVPAEPTLVPSPTAETVAPTEEPLSSQDALPEQGEILLEDDFSTPGNAWYTGVEDGNSISNLGGIMEFTVTKAAG